MIKVKVINQSGREVREESLNSEIFDVKMNEAVLHRVVRAYFANKRHSIAHTKTRSERRGGGAKPWKQKGTGRARAGSARSPIWRKGGITFGPRSERNFTLKVNKKEKRKALFISLSEKVRENGFQILDSLEMKEIKTKDAADLMKKLKLYEKKVLLVLPKEIENIEKSYKNIKNITTCRAKSLNCSTVMHADHCLFLADSNKVLEETFLKNKK